MKTKRARLNHNAMLLPLMAVFFLCFTVAAGGRDGRRVLHQPLYPIQWTPPPPPQELSDTPPDDSGPFFPGVPSPPTSTTQTPASTAASSGRQPSSASKKIVAVAASVSAAAAFAALLLIGFLLYRWHRQGISLDTGKLIVRDDSGSRMKASASSAGPPNFLYLGTVDTASSRRRSEEENGSPYRKLGTERVLEIHHPSPDLQPLPPLSTMTTRKGKIPPPTASSDEDTFYTPQRSVASATSEGTSSPVSRRSLPSMSSGGKEFLAAAVADSAPRSRRSSPPIQLADYPSSEVKQMIPATKRQPPPPLAPAPPPPPPPPPPPTGLLNTIRNPPPPPPPPQATVSSRKKERSAKATPFPPTSRRRLLNPLPPEATRLSIPLPPSQFDNGFTASSSHQAEELGKDLTGDSKPKLKPLHWDKVKATSDRAMVWDQLKSSSFKLNEAVIETLFVNNATSSLPKDASRKQPVLSFKQENSVLDPKKSQNIAILLRALNVTREEVSEALLDGNPEFLGVELLETLVKMAPTKEEELKLRDYTGDMSKLGSAERFLKAVLGIPFAFKRVDAMLYRANFETEVNYLMKSFETLEAACDDLRCSKLFLKLLEAVLRTGNRMNVGTNRGQAKAFKLDTLLKLADVKGTDGKTTLLHFVVQEITRSEGSGDEPAVENPSHSGRDEQLKKQSLTVVAGLSSELGNVRKAAGMDSDVLSSYVSKLETGLHKIKSVLQLEKSCTEGMKFFEMMEMFLQEAEKEIGRVKAEEKRVMNLVKETTEYFHGDAAKEEAHPLRIFMVVRDFLLVLDNVCKEVGKMHERTVMGCARSFRISSRTSLPVLQRYDRQRDADSDEESSTS